jgi:type VI protein secretion system component VasK
MNRFWSVITRAAAPFAVLALLLALVLTVWTVQDNRGLTQCVDRWATAYVLASNQRAEAHDDVQNALDTLIRAVPTTDTPQGAATFEGALSAYIAASNAERLAEKQHPLPVAPTLDC